MLGSFKNLNNLNANAPLEDHPLDPRREPSALEGWIREILCCDPKGSMAFLWMLSTEGRGAGLCWAHSRRKRPKGRSATLAERPVLPFVCIPPDPLRSQ